MKRDGGVSTKYFSAKQEGMIAKYLGWDVVSGSGARNFNPGDIKSDAFLGECKTHTRESDTVYCYIRVWNKIVMESKSAFKTPVLFVDNGTQLVEMTWCVVPYTFMKSFKSAKQINAESVLKLSTTRVGFNVVKMCAVFGVDFAFDEIVYCTFMLGHYKVALMPLRTFKRCIDGGDIL